MLSVDEADMSESFSFLLYRASQSIIQIKKKFFHLKTILSTFILFHPVRGKLFKLRLLFIP